MKKITDSDEKQLKEFIKQNSLLNNLFRFIHNKILYSPKRSVKGTGNKLNLNTSAHFKNCKFNITGNNNEVIINAFTFFANVTFMIHGNNNKIIISDYVRFNNGGSLWIEDDKGSIEIGEYTTFENIHIAVTEPKSKVSIGKNCLFAYDIDLRTGDSHSILDLATNKRINYAADILIGDHVWVASHVSILKGAVISSNSIVATRSVVTKKFGQQNVVLAGSPAKIIKENITWDVKKIYDHVKNNSEELAQ